MGTWRGIRSKAETAAQADSNVQAGLQQVCSFLGITHPTLCHAVRLECARSTIRRLNTLRLLKLKQVHGLLIAAC